MRAFLTGNINARDFSEKLLQIRNGTITLCNNDGFIKLVNEIELAHEVKIHDKLIMIVFPDLEENYNDQNWLCERAISCPKMMMLLIMNCYVICLELFTVIN